MFKPLQISLLLSAVVLSICLTSCNKLDKKMSYPKSREEIEDEKIGKLTGKGIVIFGDDSKSSKNIGVNVNSCIWRASIVHSMPILSADPFGGTILTDWYKIGVNSHERYKINVFILGASLRSDAVRVTVFKEKQNVNGIWNQVSVSKKLAQQIEDKILERAREIKMKSDED